MTRSAVFSIVGKPVLQASPEIDVLYGTECTVRRALQLRLYERELELGLAIL
jgi:hypothetical protein